MSWNEGINRLSEIYSQQPTDEGRELIFGLLEGLSLTSLISYSPSNQGNEKEYESEEGEKGKRKSMDSFGRLPLWSGSCIYLSQLTFSFYFPSLDSYFLS